MIITDKRIIKIGYFYPHETKQCETRQWKAHHYVGQAEPLIVVLENSVIIHSFSWPGLRLGIDKYLYSYRPFDVIGHPSLNLSQLILMKGVPCALMFYMFHSEKLHWVIRIHEVSKYFEWTLDRISYIAWDVSHSSIICGGINRYPHRTKQ